MSERAEKLKAEIAAELMAEAPERERKSLEASLSRARVPRNLWDVSMDKIPDTLPYKPLLQKWGRLWLRQRAKEAAAPGLLLHGPPGSGKTSIAAGFARWFLTMKVPVLFQPYRDIWPDKKNAVPYDPDLLPGETIEDAWTDATVLVLDDLLAGNNESYGEVGLNIVEEVLRDRLALGRATIVTSNADVDTISKVRARLGHVLVEHCYPIRVEGADYRKAIAKKRLSLEEVDV